MTFKNGYKEQGILILERPVWGDEGGMSKFLSFPLNPLKTA